MKSHPPSKTGKIIPHGVKPEPHEFDTYLYYTDLGEDIELIPASHTPGVKSPDILMRGLMWEVKCPVINTRKSAERVFYKAAQQSSNLIIDLRKLKGKEDAVLKTLLACVKTTRKVRNLHIITKSGKLEVYKK